MFSLSCTTPKSYIVNPNVNIVCLRCKGALDICIASSNDFFSVSIAVSHKPLNCSISNICGILNVMLDWIIKKPENLLSVSM